VEVVASEFIATGKFTVVSAPEYEAATKDQNAVGIVIVLAHGGVPEMLPPDFEIENRVTPPRRCNENRLLYESAIACIKRTHHHCRRLSMDSDARLPLMLHFNA
jgi:hypothetical protein